MPHICHFALDFLTHFSLFTLVCVNIDRARTVRKHRPSSKFPRSTFHTVLMTEFLIALILGCYHSHWLIKFGYEGKSSLMDGEHSGICLFDES